MYGKAMPPFVFSDHTCIQDVAHAAAIDIFGENYAADAAVIPSLGAAKGVLKKGIWRMEWTPIRVELMKDGLLNDTPSGIAALHSCFPSGGLNVRIRFCNGNFEDGKDGSPANTTFDEAGHLVSTIRFRNGVANDSLSGEPANVYYYNNFASPVVEKVFHLSDGREHDPISGGPACRWFWPDGSIKMIAYCQNGKKNDPPSGEPALQEFGRDGRRTIFAHYNEDSAITVKAAKALHATALRDRVMRCVDSADPVVSVVGMAAARLGR